MTDPENLWQDDDGRDEDVKANDVDEFKISDKVRIITFLLPTHKRAPMAKFTPPQGSNKFGYRCYLTDDMKEFMAGDGRSYLEPHDRWFNIVFDYILDMSGKQPQLPISGSVLFFQFDKAKYMDIREILEQKSSDFDGMDLQKLQILVRLDGDEKYQKMKFSAKQEKDKTHLRMFAGAQVLKLEGEEAEKFEITDEVRSKINEVGYLPPELDKHSPLMTELQEKVNDILSRVPAYKRFARHATVQQIKDDIGGAAISEQEKKAEENTTSVDDMKAML